MAYRYEKSVQEAAETAQAAKGLEEGSRRKWRALLPFAWPILSAPAAYFLGKLLAMFPNALEILYSRFIYQLETVESLLIGAAPFSVGEIALVAAFVCFCVWFLFALMRVRRYPVRFVACLLGILSVVSVCAARFTLAWGLNYHRATLPQMLRLDVRERPVEELEQLVARLAIEANHARQYLFENRNGIFDPGGVSETLQAASDATMAMGANFAPFDRAFPKAKPLLLSSRFSKLGISGIYNPLTVEANVNVDEPKLLWAASACHELAHMAGFARENEANFLAFYATRFSGDLHVRYSGTILALLHAGNALYARDPDAYYAVRDIYSDGLNRDLQDHLSYWNAQKGPAREAMEEVNDAYLKSHGEKSGVESYGEMVDLILAFYDKS